MQHVQAKWLRICNYGLVLLTAILFFTRFVFEHLQVSEATKSHWGITPLILAIGGFHALYILVIYPFLYKRYTWAVNFTSFAIYAFLFAAIIDASGNVNIVYRLGYGGLIFLMALNGWLTPLMAVLLTWLILLFTITGVTTGTRASLLYNLIIDTLISVAALLGWLVFRRWYELKADKQALQLDALLKEERSKSGVILESITDGVIVIDSSGTIQVINNSGAMMLGWSQQEAINLDYKSITVISNVDSDESQSTAISDCLKSKQPEQKVSNLTTKNGKRLYVDIVASPIFQTAQNDGLETQKFMGVIAVLRDVDKQKQQEQQRSDFISTASHEMRTPVAAIEGFIELSLNPKVSTIDDKARSYLEKARKSTQQLGQLFQDLLTASKSEDGRLDIRPTLIEVGEFLEEAVEPERMAAEKKGLKIVFDENDQKIRPLMYVNADPNRLREVLLNLFDNAIKYTPAGIITLGASMKEQSVVMRVSDTGQGIAEEDINHLFQKFYRTDNTATREIGGTGLGLYICKQIVEAMHGRIWVESSIGAGSTFFVELPRVSPETVGALRDSKP